MINHDQFWYKNNDFHREDGPAVIKPNGDKYWFQNGKRHRIDGPAVECTNGHKVWYKNGNLHCEDGPAIENPNGDKFWYKEGRLHRIDGPAIEKNGEKWWYIEGLLHNSNGPAITIANDLFYSLEGINLSKYKYDIITNFPQANPPYLINKHKFNFIKLNETLGLRCNKFTELWINGKYIYIDDKDLNQLVNRIDKINPFLNPIHDYIMEKWLSIYE
jgi:hypothetical protein